MTDTQKRRNNERGGQRPRRSSKPARPAAVEAAVDSRLGNLTAYAGYVGAAVLIYQSVSGFSEQPAFGFTWSPAVLGVVLAVATVLFRNELDLRSRLKVFDLETASRPVVSLAWGILGVIAIVAIMTLPRF